MFLVIPYAYVHMDSFPIYRLLQPKENNETQLFKNTSAKMQNTLRTSKLKDSGRFAKQKDETQILKNTLARMQTILRASKQARGRSREESCDIEIALLRNRSLKEFGTSPVGLSVSK